MSNSTSDLWETLLQRIAESTPGAWYPSQYARMAGVDRDSLDLPLEKLRLSGLVQLTDWVKGLGQGYVLTPEGTRFLREPQTVVATNREPARGVPIERREPPQGLSVDPALREKALAVRDDLTRPFTPAVTWLLLFINFLFFGYALHLASPDREAVLQMTSTPKADEIRHQTGAIRGKDIFEDGQWWRLLSCCFVHIGWIHLAVNMYSLFMVGPLLERMWGHACFLVLYLITGVAGSCALLIENPNVMGAGASGALWGIIASMATWLYFNRRVLPRSLISDWRRQLIIIFLLNAGITLAVPIISKGAHFGGGVAGLIVAVPLYYLRWGRGWQRPLAALGVLAVPVLCLGMLYERSAVAGFFNLPPYRADEPGTNADGQKPSVNKKRKRTDAVPDGSADQPKPSDNNKGKQTDAVSDESDEVFDKASQMLRKDLDVRGPKQEVKQIVDDLKMQIKRLNVALLDSLDASGASAKVTRARRDYLNAQIDLLQEVQNQLEESKRDLESRNVKEEKMKSLREKWLKLKEQADRP